MPPPPRPRLARRHLILVVVPIHASLILLYPNPLTIGLGLWWNANTVSHNFIHRPFFRSGLGNATFSLLLSLLLFLPQSVWRDRHLAHHRGRAPRIRRTGPLALDATAVTAQHLLLLGLAPTLYLFAVLPGIALGLVICAIHGHYEHPTNRTISHHGRLYNALFFNDGYHAEHHAHPGADWHRLPTLRQPATPTSRWPAVLRSFDGVLDQLEHLVIGRPVLERFVLTTHQRAWRRILPDLDSQPIRSVCIVGGGLFPRTALLLSQLLPHARITILEGDAQHLESARQRLTGTTCTFERSWFHGTAPAACDLLVLPLAYRGDRNTIRRHPPARHVVLHDWIWARRTANDRAALVSPWLLKRLTLLPA